MASSNGSSNNDDENDGIVDRLAKALFASPNSPLTAFADRQRIERMEQCTQLANILSACQAIKAGKQLDSTEDAILPPSKSAARISRFFKWNGEEEHRPSKSSALDDAFSSLGGRISNGNEGDDDNTQGNTATTATTRPRYSADCAIETHELWACRALAVGCGNHLAELRRCWDRQNSVATVVMREQDDVKEEGIEFYKDPTKEDLSCRNIQMNMARCVNRHVAELNERQTLQKTKRRSNNA